jgi:hypothetical protein
MRWRGGVAVKGSQGTAESRGMVVLLVATISLEEEEEWGRMGIMRLVSEVRQRIEPGEKGGPWVFEDDG